MATFIVNCLNIAYSKKVAEISQKKEKVYYDSAIYLSHSTRALVTYCLFAMKYRVEHKLIHIVGDRQTLPKQLKPTRDLEICMNKVKFI